MSRPMDLKGSIIIKCKRCKARIDLKSLSRSANLKGIRELRCPMCNEKVGMIN